jgi:hypothetical protein
VVNDCWRLERNGEGIARRASGMRARMDPTTHQVRRAVVHRGSPTALPGPFVRRVITVVASSRVSAPEAA